MENRFYQEAVSLNNGANFLPIRMKLRLPEQKNDVSVYLLSDSFEYDIQLIKMMPAPKIEYKKILIPFKVIDKLGMRPLRYMISQNDYMKKISYINEQKLLPKLQPIQYPYPKTIKENMYIPMSDFMRTANINIRSLSIKYIQEHIFDMFLHTLNFFNYSNTKVLLIDTTRYKIYNNPTPQNYKSDIINALLTAYVYNEESSIKPLNVTLIFRTQTADYKFDLRTFNRQRDITKYRKLLQTIGTASEMTSTTDEDAGESIDSFENKEDLDIEDSLDNSPDDIEEKTIEDEEVQTSDTEEIKELQKSKQSATSSIQTSISKLSTKYNTDTTQQVKEKTSVYDAKTLDINSRLLNKINPSTNILSNYRVISNDIEQNDSNGPVEKTILDNTAKNMAKQVAPVNVQNANNTTSSPRELKIRENIGKLKLNNVSFNTLASVTDVPLPKAVKPLHLSTTNAGALKGSSFATIAKEYEDKLLDRDIVTTFMNLSKLPDGFYVTDVKVTDISDSTSLLNNWKVTLKNRQTQRQSIVNIRVPKLKNGRFYNNGIWYNIGKQDFPIPILKIDKKKVMLTSNYNKISVNRYDTKSLVDIGMLIKTLKGTTKYIHAGSSTSTNNAYVSTIEYDEYAKQWYSFINKEANCEIYFNRKQCAKLYSFVDVKPDEFCCGMINKIPVVLNTESGLTRKGITLTETMLETLPVEYQKAFHSSKPGKMSMYSECKLDAIKIPLGVACCAWEGLSNVLKKGNIQHQFVDKSFSDKKYFIIPFKNKNLAIQNTISNQLLFNGFYRINTKAYDVSDFETPIMDTNSLYVDIFNQMFFRQYSQLTTFITCYEFFVDAITSDVCLHYNLPNDIVGMLLYASNLLADNNCASENNSALYRIRSSEIIPAIIHYRLAMAISRYNNNVGSKVRGNPLVFNPNEVINELLAVPNVEPMSALNPMSELHVRENITKKGFKGVNTDRAYNLTKRTYDETMIGKMAISSPNNGTVGVTRQLTANPKLESVRGYTSPNSVGDDATDVDLASFSELLTPGTVTRDDAIRTAIATSQTSHIISVDDAEPAMISNGVDEIVPSYLTDEFAVTASEDGKVIDQNDVFLIVQYKSGKKQAVPIGDKYSFNSGSGFYVNNKLRTTFKVGDTFKQNDILAYHEKFFSKGADNVVRMNIGPLAKVAFMGTYSTYEDAGVMTQSMSKRMTTNVTMMQDIKIKATDDIESVVKVGDHVEVGDPLIVFGIGDTGDKNVDNFLKAFQTNKSTNVINNAKRVYKATHSGKVVDVRMYTTKSLDKLSSSLYTILDEHFKENKKKRKILDKYDNTTSTDKLGVVYTLPTEPIKGSSIKGRTCDVLIEIYIEHSVGVGIGDKAVCYGASKQIISEMIPEGEEPFSERKPHEEISMFVSSGSIIKRKIPSVMIIAAANKILIELKDKLREIWEE